MRLSRLLVSSLVLWAGVFLAGAAVRAQTLFREPFEGTALEPVWAVDVSEGNSVALKEGRLEISARENSFAHIRRPLGEDLVRASAEIRPAPAMSWCTSVFLYWKPGDWCQMGITGRDGGRFYACVMAEGVPREHDLGRCAFDRWQEVGIELARDCLRFVARPEGGDWKAELLAARPPSFEGPPAFLILGKGYGRGEPPYPKPHLDNDYAEKGGPGISAVRDAAVERLERGRGGASAEEMRLLESVDRDVLGEMEISSSRDPTFESVASHFPALKRPREVVSVKDHPHDIGVAPDGSLQLSDDAGRGPAAFFEVGSPPARFGSGPAGCAKRLLDGYLPVVLCRFGHDGLEYEETLFGWSQDLSPDEDLIGFVRLDARNPGSTERSVDAAFRVEGVAKPWRKSWKLQVPPGGSSAVFLKVPFDAERRPAEEARPEEFEEALRQVRDFWKAHLASGVRIEVPEERVMNAWRALLAWGFLNVDKRGGIYEPHDGAGFYELVYGYSAALWCNALDLYGFHADSRRYLESLLSLQRPDGLFTQNFGTPDPGALLLALSEHHRFTEDSAWLGSVASRMVKMCDWIVAKRKESMKIQEGKRPVTYGLILFSPYCDFQAPCYDYFGDAYCCSGLEAAAEAFDRAPLSDDTVRIREEAKLYRKDILDSMDAAAVERGGMKILPMEPDTRRLLKDGQWRAGGYYGLIASCMLETGFLRPSDERARLVTDFLERKGGLILGMSEFAGGVDHAYSYGYWMQCIRRVQEKRAILGLYGSLAYGMSRETFAGVEVTRLKTGDNEPTLPHLYSSTQVLRLLRSMLLLEDGGVLTILPAAPCHWLEAGKRIAVEKAPTRFGRVSFSVRSEIDKGRAMVELELPPARTPRYEVLIRLRTPDRRPIRSVQGGGDSLKGFSGEWVNLRSPRGRRIELQVGF